MDSQNSPTRKSTDNDLEDDVFSSGTTLSYWLDSTEPILFDELHKDITVDVVIVGGGIAGVITAYALAKEGRSVAIVEDGQLGSGETGRTTAHLATGVDERYFEIEKMFDALTAKKVAAGHTRAINVIESIVNDEQIKCDFERLDGYLFLHPSEKAELLSEELTASQHAGLKTEMMPDIPGIPVEKGRSLRFPNQAQFHILKFLKGVADAIVKRGGRIFTKTHADKIDHSGVTTSTGYRITAGSIVLATNSPINDIVTMHTKQAAYRTYVIAGPVPKDSVLRALWWDSGDKDSESRNEPYHYIRTQPLNDHHDLLMVGGEDHKTGQPYKEDD